jgi:hypothetical protein
MSLRKVALGLVFILVAQTAAFADSGDPLPPRKGPRNLTPEGTKAPNGEVNTRTGRVDYRIEDGRTPEPPPAGAGCAGEVEIQPADSEYDVTHVEQTKDKDGKVRSVVVKDYSVQVKTFACGGKVFGVVKRCKVGSGTCPPSKPRPRIAIRSVVRHLALDDTFTLPLPDIRFTPEPSNVAPLVGLPMFYGVPAEQWNREIVRVLHFCTGSGFDADCGTIEVHAKPTAVKFDPGASLEDKTIIESCQQPIPEVQSFEDARNEQKRKCAVVFQNAGVYDINIGLRYLLTATLLRYTWEGAESSIEKIPVNVWATISLPIHQVQPVLKNK